VLRETLSNVARHAHASSVSVTIEIGERVAVTVIDDGVGFAEGTTGGSGLRNLDERSRAFGGSFTIGPGASAGTVATWTVPRH
jgi:signal transduction histidine kinase